MVTARFCQLDTGDSDACDILRSKLRIANPEERDQRDRDQQRRKNQGYGGHGQDAAASKELSAEEPFFCGICKTDRCNGAAAITLALGSILAMLVLQLGC